MVVYRGSIVSVKTSRLADTYSPPGQEGFGGGRLISYFPLMERTHNKKSLKERRKHLRNNGTSAEATLWRLISNKKLAGRKFRRQHSVENYILDFYCPSEKLAIELDGERHFTELGLMEDEKRDQRLLQLGITVLRFENEDVFKATNAVLEKIVSHFNHP